MTETRYAVNLADLTALPTLGLVLRPLTPNRVTVEINKQRIDGIGLVLECDPALGRDVVAAIRQRHKRYSGSAGPGCRCYELAGSKARAV